MSRIGKLPVTIPNGVQVTKSDSNLITVKGVKGELKQLIDNCIVVKIDGNTLTFHRSSDEKSHRSKHGLYRALVQNMIIGVTEGFKIGQELVGVGYKAQVQGQNLELTLGYSHNILFQIPSEIKILATQDKGKNPIITMESYDKQLLGQVAAKIRSLRKPEPYKGKGIKFVGENLRRKAGKSASKK